MADLQSISADDRMTRWVHEHARAIRGYLLGLVRNASDADELAQETFRRAWEARDRYQEQGQERAYLLRIADRLACDRLRKRGRELQLDAEGWQAREPQIDDEPHRRLDQSETSGRLNAAMEALSEMQRRVLLLRYFGELEFAAIAEATGCPLGTVLSHCHRGLESLRKRLTEIVHET
jgi:RNA polymerase sigma-70 factor (ECF subfamily)